MWLWAIAVAIAGSEEPAVAAAAEDAAADPPARAAEIDRLSDELERLVARNVWPGVERTFQQLVALGADLRFEDWVRGAQAARARGDVAAVRDRLIAAAALREDPTVDAWLADIDTRYGRAVLRADPRARVRLERASPPMDPDLVNAIAFARRELAGTGTFDGLLPVGLYRVLDTRFGVTARLPAEVDLRGARIPPSRRRELRRAWREDRRP